MSMINDILYAITDLSGERTCTSEQTCTSAGLGHLVVNKRAPTIEIYTKENNSSNRQEAF